jgi:uncharacterized membrane protein
MDKEFEFLKIKYEHSKAWVLSLLVLTISSVISTFTFIDKFPEISNNLRILSIIFVFGLVIFFIQEVVYYRKITKYLTE